MVTLGSMTAYETARSGTFAECACLNRKGDTYLICNEVRVNQLDAVRPGLCCNQALALHIEQPSGIIAFRYVLRHTLGVVCNLKS